MAKIRARLALLCAAGLVAQTISPARAARPATIRMGDPLPVVTVTGVVENNDSVKIDYLPVPGAKDYRVFDTSNPGIVKYAGMASHMDAGNWGHNRFMMQPDGVTPIFPYQVGDSSVVNGPTTLDVPSTEIEWNGLDNGPHTLVVQALDALGPVPAGNLYDVNNSPLSASTMPGMVMPDGAMLGSNLGKTPDGMDSINGQGPSTNTPHVVAQSQPFVAQANPTVRPLPSRPDATQSVLDTFGNTEAASLKQVGSVDPNAGVMTYTLNAGAPNAWGIQYLGADTRDSMPMIEHGHFMDTLFDGGTPGTNNPLHNNHAVMAMSPDQTADLSGGKLLHLTMEVDAHESPRRWVAFNLAPANDPFTNWYTVNSPINTSDHGLFVQLFPGVATADVYNGPTSSTNPAPADNHFWGAAGQSPYWTYRYAHFGGNGIALDNRSRFDLFLTTTRLALFEDGQLVAQSTIPGGLPFDKAKVYFTHYLYHTANDINELPAYETYWHNSFPYSDERHWDNMGFEVLPPQAVPAGTDWSSLAALVKMPAVTPPVFNPMADAPTAVAPSTTSTPPALPVTTNATATSTSSATVTPSQTATATAVPSVTASATTVPSATATSTIAPSTATPIDSPGAATPTTTPPGLPGAASTTPTTSNVTGLPSGRYTVETRIIDAQGNVKLVSTAPLVIP